MTQEAFCNLTQEIRDRVILAVFVCIIDGLGNHGGFLRAYGRAVAYADQENFALIRPASEAVILKYDLCRYATVVGTVVTCQNKEGLRAGADGNNYER